MYRIWNLSVLACLTAVLSPAFGRAAEKTPLVEGFLLDGKLVEGAEALEDQVKAEPKDDQARFGLGVLQFLQTFEHLGGSLHRYGLRTEKAFLRPPPQVKEFLPQNPNPEKLDYAAARKIVQTFVDDVVRAEATLAEVKDPAVKLPLHVGLIKIDPFGQHKPISAAFLFERVEGLRARRQHADDFVIGFDRGDVHWLCGYCHLLSALGELCLAVDGQKRFECSAHLFFEKVETPYTFLLQSSRALDEHPLNNRETISDVISFIHQLTRLPIKEPARLKAALAHFEAGVAQGKELWKFILGETDDDHEWIPNPKQTGVIAVHVTQEMVDAWRETLDEAEQVLQGKKLLPFLARRHGGAGHKPAPRLHRAATNVRRDRVGAGDGGNALFGERTGYEVCRSEDGNAANWPIRRAAELRRLRILVQLSDRRSRPPQLCRPKQQMSRFLECLDPSRSSSTIDRVVIDRVVLSTGIAFCRFAFSSGARYRYNWPAKRSPRTTRMAKKKEVAAKKPKVDRDFMDLLKAANTPEEAGNKASAIDSSVIGLFETALTTLKDAKHRVAQDKDITKELLNAIEYLQFGISKLKAANK